MKKRALFLLPLTAALLLAGCSDTAPEAETGHSTPASPDQLDAQALNDIAQEIADGNDQAVIVDKEALKAQLPMAEQARKAMTVSPEACADFVGGDLGEELERMNVISVALPGASALEGVQVQLASFADPADATANMAQADEILKDCADFSFTLQGQETKMGVKGLQATTDAEKTSAIQTTTTAKETTLTTVSVNALEGPTVIAVTVMGGNDADKDLAEAQERAGAVLDLVAKAAAR